MTLTFLDSSKLSLNSVQSEYFSSLQDHTPNLALISEVIKLELMNLRHPTAHTKTRAEVRGGGKKPWKQKGTGRARHGSIRSPIWVGGGVTFGPRNSRNWHRKINKSSRISALKSILSDRLISSGLMVSSNLNFEKTKEAVSVFEFLKTQNQTKSKLKVAVLYTTAEKDTLNGLRNIAEFDLINVGNLSIHRLAKNQIFIFTDAAAQFLSTRLEN